MRTFVGVALPLCIPLGTLGEDLLDLAALLIVGVLAYGFVARSLVRERVAVR